MTTTTNPTKKEVSTKEIYQFIKLYRAFEELSLKLGCILIREALKKYPGHGWQIEHCCDQWRYKERDFGTFYLNLDPENQMCFIKYWGFAIEGDETYILHIQQDPSAAMFLKPPAIVQAFHNVVMFFCNHGIDEGSCSDISLPALAPVDKQYGCSKNWGDYIIRLNPHFTNEHHQLLEAIRDFYPNKELTNQ